MKKNPVLKIAVLFLVVLICAAPATIQEVRPLTSGQQTWHDLKITEKHVYSIKMAAGDFLRLEVESRGLDAGLTLSTEDGKKLSSTVEFLSYLATAKGTYLIEVKATDETKSGQYLLRVDGPRASTEQDKKSIDAERVLREGTRLADEHAADSQQKAIERFKEALAFYREIKDKRGEASVLNALGMAYDYLTLYKEALGYYEQTLLLKRELRDRRGEATADVNLSFAHFHLDQFEPARKYMEDALAVYRETKDKEGESEALKNIEFINDKLIQAKTPSSSNDQAKPQTNKGDPKGRSPSNTSSVCVCRELQCNAYTCWWHYYYCYC